MARVNFPNSPTNGQEYTSSGATYTYNSSKGTWNAMSTLSGITSADISMATPATASSSGGINYDSAGEFTFIPAVIPATATSVYATAADLPLSDNPVGNKAFVVATKRLYLWNGSGWYNIALVNTDLTMTTGSAATYTLATDGTDTVITLVANDPEDVPITWSYAVTSGSLGSTATVSQADNVFTITPSTTDSGSFSLTFTASDGINTATSTSAFSLQLIPTGRATFLNDNPTSAAGGLGTHHSWSVPTGVTSISILCIGAGGSGDWATGGGGGGLSWKNNITVTPGQVVTIEAGNGGRNNGDTTKVGNRSKAEISGVFNVYALGGSTSGGTLSVGGAGGGGGTAIGGGDGGGYGGNGGHLAGRYGGGGGAAGYTGNGGHGGYGGDADGGSNSSGTGHGQSGAGGGGGGGSSGGAGASGGGVGIYGQGANGNGGSFLGHTWGNPGRGGSGGEFANPGHGSATPGGNYGGGGGSRDHVTHHGGDGVVTIIWGDNRVYPSTNVDLASDT